jgi:ABC-type uncharacterized transport system involved in gliding motility auxiliary subunit
MVPSNTGLEKLLEHYGVRVKQAYALDEHCYKQQLPEQYGGGEQPLYFAPIIESASINSSLPFMKNIKQLIAFKTAPLEIDQQRIQADKLKALRLFSSSNKSWEMKGVINLNPMFIRPPSAETAMKSIPLAYIIEGSFPSYFAGKPIPVKPSEPAPQAGIKTPDPAPSASEELQHKGDFISASKPAKIFVMGSPEMLTDSLISEQADNPDATFIMNVIDILNNHADIAMMRGKVQSFNPLEVKNEQVKVLAKGFNIAGLPMIVVIFGLIMWIRRTTRRHRIEAMFNKQRSEA